MSEFTDRINQIKYKYEEKQRIKQKLEDLLEKYQSTYIDFDLNIETQRILATVADENTSRVVNFIQNVINKALLQMYPTGEYYIEVKKSMHGGTNPKMDVVLYNNKGIALDLEDQAGDGIARIVSLLFSLSVIELNGSRKFIAADEVLNGFHEDSLVIVKSILDLFAKGGFQFVLSEYDILDMGTIYEAKMNNQEDTSELTRLGDAREINYTRNLTKTSSSLLTTE